MELLSSTNDGAPHLPRGRENQDTPLRLAAAFLERPWGKPRPPPSPEVLRYPENKPAPYTVSELIRLPAEEFHCYLRTIGASVSRGENIDEDLRLIRTAQGVLRRTDDKIETWMNAVRAELNALHEQLRGVCAGIQDEIRQSVERNCRGALKANIFQKRTAESELDELKTTHAEKSGVSRVLSFTQSIYRALRLTQEIGDLDEEFPVERNHGIKIAANGAAVDLEQFDFLPGSQGSDIKRYIDAANQKLLEYDRMQQENERRVQALIRTEGLAYRMYGEHGEDWPLPDPMLVR